MSALRDVAIPIERYTVPDALIAATGDARIVMLGEATHGTSEFYAMRAAISQRLISEHGFCAIALEADWPDVHRVARYVSGDGDDPNAQTALEEFQRFPSWMWRNSEFVAFVEWLKYYNVEAQSRCTLLGMDLYSLHRSMSAVISYLEWQAPELAQRARERYACFDPAGGRGD
ncbi:MAG: erythromycin esterase family protein, partial [Candidatus Eremiobacteraeota bacterium]|nr:erythromycin esterase family protein [Candidatus Eremiobacteraeota bacterium]